MSIVFTEKFVEPTQHSLWIQDYEPTKLSGIIGNAMTIETIDSFLRSDRVPNLILCGPNGCGKTITAKILVREYLGKYYDTNHLEIIGSIYRGKNVVSEKNDKKKPGENSSDSPNIVNFIKKKNILPPNKCRVVTIYDFDCMTNEAQMALRRIIEIYSEKIRFIFICNNLNKIIEAVQSRTLILKFYPISLEDIISRLKEIAEIKCLTLSDEIYHAIGIISNNDLKQAINYLQVFSHSTGKQLENFYDIFNMPSISSITQLIKYCQQKEGANAFKIIDQLIENGYNVTDILDIVIKVLVYNKELNDKVRVHMIEETIKIICICEQSSSLIHLYKLAILWINAS